MRGAGRCADPPATALSFLSPQLLYLLKERWDLVWTQYELAYAEQKRKNPSLPPLWKGWYVRAPNLLASPPPSPPPRTRAGGFTLPPVPARPDQLERVHPGHVDALRGAQEGDEGVRGGLCEDPPSRGRFSLLTAPTRARSSHGSAPPAVRRMSVRPGRLRPQEKQLAEMEKLKLEAQRRARKARRTGQALRQSLPSRA